MSAFVALLRAVNVGGRNLAMSDLKTIAETLGLDSPRTFIASGNLLFRSDAEEGHLKRMLEDAVSAHMGASVAVMIRSANETAAVAACNPFQDKPGNRVVAIFLDDPPPADALSQATGVADERMELGTREIYVAYGSGVADSKLRIPAAKNGTARNMNTVARLAELAREMS